MFHTLLTLSYVIPGIYLFARIWMLFIPAKYRMHFIAIFLLIFAVYPVSNLFDERGTGFPGNLITSFANYLLPFFLYTFLLILLTDIVLLINLPLRIIPREKLKDKFLMMKVFFIIITLSALIVVAGIINFNTVRITEYRISVPGRATKLKNLKIAFVSDFHLQDGVSIGFVERFVKKTGEINPDLFIFGGDIVEGDREGENMVKFEKLLGSIKTRYGVYGVLGNHEHYSRQDQGSFFRKSGIEIITDTIIIKDHLFAIAGRNDSRSGNRMTASALASMAPDSLPLIMADHRPTETDLIGKTETDIAFSGHTHHGQLFPINLITSKVYKLSYGYMKEGNTHFFVSSGIRLWGPPVRTTARSEIVVVNVEF